MIKTNDSFGETPETSSSLGKIFGIGLVILALFSFLGEEKTNKISIAGIKKRKSKRLFYMLDTERGLTTVSRQEATNIKKSSPNRLHAVWALTADDARALIGQGQGERYTQSKKLDFAGHLLNCIGWQQVIDKNGKKITRCFIMAPNCKTKACVRETEQRKAEGWKPKSRKVKLEGVNSKSFVIDNEGKIAMVVGKENGKPVVIYPGNEGGTRAGSAQQGGGQPYEFVLNSWTLATEKDFNKVIRPSGSPRMNDLRRWRRELQTGLQGVNLSCKQYVRDAYNKLRCKKFAITCNSENECGPKAPIPWKQAEVEYTPKAIKSVAKVLAEEMNQSIDDTKRVMRSIKSHGGIAPYAGGYLQEEYRDIPSKYKSKEGIKLDELAQEMEMNESELVEAIGKAEEARSRLPRGKRRFTVKDLMFDAENYLHKQESGLQGLGFTKRDAAEAMTHEYAAFMRKLQDTALDLIDKSPADRAKIERFKGDVKIISATNAPTYKQAREMIYPNLDYIFYEIIEELSPNFRTSENLRNIQSEIIYRQEKYTPPATTSKKMPNEPTQRKPEKKIAEKGGQMTLFGRLKKQLGDVDREKETFAEYEARIKAGIKRDLSPTQERQLLSYHATGDFEYGATNLRETMRVLMEQGYAKENKNRQFEITPKGVEYLDGHSLAIRSGNNPKSKEMTQYEKRKLQEQLERYDTMVKESKKTEKKIAEKGGQMTLFGRMVARKIAMRA